MLQMVCSQYYCYWAVDYTNQIARQCGECELIFMCQALSLQFHVLLMCPCYALLMLVVSLTIQLAPVSAWSLVSCRMEVVPVTRHDTTDSSDYEVETTTLHFDACQRRECVTILTVDDCNLEAREEVFKVELKRPKALDRRIRHNTTAASVAIRDNDCKRFKCANYT